MIDESYLQLHTLAVELYKLGMRQAAGDFDYLASWLDSSNWKGQNGVRAGVIPNGKQESGSTLPPIPCFSENDIIRCSDLDTANTVLNAIYQCIGEIKSSAVDIDVLESLDCFETYTEEVIEEGGGDPPIPPTPPVPPSNGGLKIITIDLITDKESSCSAPNIDYIDL